MKASLSITCFLLLSPILFSGPACTAGKSFPASPVQEASGHPEIKIPEPDQEVATPLRIEGVAPGTWFFEGRFPIQLRDEKGEVLAAKNAEAEGSWMTEAVVPFSAELPFVVSEEQPGKLVLEKANPSGKPENAASVATPVRLNPPAAVNAAGKALADKLNLSPSAIRARSVERVQWPDACLGLDQKKMCAQVITPGYRIILRAEQETYEYRTDLSGSQVLPVD